MTDVSPVQPGEMLAGKYRVEQVLGSGGMGIVVAAIHVELGQRVALKFLLPQALENVEAAQRFLREARAAVKIESEHVARVLDVGRLDNGAPYMVMEYLEGTDLSLYAKGADLPVEQAVDFVLQACAAMAVAHAAGIVHRDLKPANLFVTQRPDGSPLLKVLDFGISKVSVLDAPAILTHTSAMMGSPLYMSPEQVQSARRVDVRTDVWSLGVILYELLTGVTPFEGESLGEVLTAVMTATPRLLREQRPEIPSGLERAVLRALEKPLDRRYANIGEFAGALVEFAPASSRVLFERVSGVMNRAGFSSVPPPSLPPAGDKTVQSPPSEVLPLPLPARSSTPPVGATNGNWVGAAPAPRSNRRTSLVLGGVLALVGVVGFAAVVLHGHPTAESGTALSAVPVLPRAPAPRTATPAAMPLVLPTAETSAEPAVAPTPPVVAPVPPPPASADPASLPHPAAKGSSKRSTTASTASTASTAAVTPLAAPVARKKSPLSIEFK